MIWVLMKGLYLLVGGVLAPFLMHGHSRTDGLVLRLGMPLALCLTLSTIALWPILLALAVTRNDSNER